MGITGTPGLGMGITQHLSGRTVSTWSCLCPYSTPLYLTHQTSALKTDKISLKEVGWRADDEADLEVYHENTVWPVEIMPPHGKHFSWKAFCVQMSGGEIGRVACTDSRNDDTLIC